MHVRFVVLLATCVGLDGAAEPFMGESSEVVVAEALRRFAPAAQTAAGLSRMKSPSATI